MPKGVTKDEFENFKKYYEPDVFRAAGKRIRAMARAADHLSIEERILESQPYSALLEIPIKKQF
jgi:two-component sensor histidine kinase